MAVANFNFASIALCKHFLLFGKRLKFFGKHLEFGRKMTVNNENIHNEID